MILFLLAILTKADVPRLTVEELHAKLKSGDAIAVDVRGGVPYEIAHIPGAVWMPLGVLSSRAGELPEDKLLVTYCTCKAEETSLQAAMWLSNAGFKNVAVLHGGYPAWTAAGFATDSRRDDELPAPAAVSCSGKLRKVSGTVTEYKRLAEKTELKIDAEAITLSGKDPSRSYIVHGTPFMPNDWNRIEAKKGELHKGLRANAWLCEGGLTVVDWLP